MRTVSHIPPRYPISYEHDCHAALGERPAVSSCPYLGRPPPSPRTRTPGESYQLRSRHPLDRPPLQTKGAVPS